MSENTVNMNIAMASVPNANLREYTKELLDSNLHIPDIDVKDDAKVQLTDEEVDELLITIHEVNKDNKNIQTIKKITSGEFNPDELPSDEVKKKVFTSIDPVSGRSNGVVNTGYGKDSENDLIEDFINDTLDETNLTIDSFTTDEIRKSIINSKMVKEDKLTDDNVLQLVQAFNKIAKKEKIKYDDLPEFMQKLVNRLLLNEYQKDITAPLNDKLIKNFIAGSVIEQLYGEIINTRMDSVCIDLKTGIQNLAEKQIKSESAKARQMYYRTFVERFPVLSAECREKGDTAKADLLDRVSKGYISAHTLNDMYSAFNTGKIKVKKIDLEKIHKHYHEFNSKYEWSVFTINDITTCVDILDRYVKKAYTMESIKAFIVLFCKYTRDMKPTRQQVDEHTFMYYFIDNIVTLDTYDRNDETEKEYYDKFLKNVENFLNLITQKISWIV